MSYVSSPSYYSDPRPVYYQGSRYEPVPWGWGVVVREMAGPGRIAIGQPPEMPEAECLSCKAGVTVALAVAGMALGIFATKKILGSK